MRTVASKSFNRFKLLAGIVLIMIVVQIINSQFGYALNQFGIIPRTTSGLLHIPLSCWIHGSWSHLFANLPPFIILSTLILARSHRDYLFGSTLIIVFSGLLLWLFGRTGSHIGASGWVFGLWSWLVANAFYRRRFIDIVVGLGVLVYYGLTMFMNMLPLHSYVSYDGHITGAIAGVLTALTLHKLTVTRNNTYR